MLGFLIFYIFRVVPVSTHIWSPTLKSILLVSSVLLLFLDCTTKLKFCKARDDVLHKLDTYVEKDNLVGEILDLQIMRWLSGVKKKLESD